jgi:hypothetical protein
MILAQYQLSIKAKIELLPDDLSDNPAYKKLSALGSVHSLLTCDTLKMRTYLENR